MSGNPGGGFCLSSLFFDFTALFVVNSCTDGVGDCGGDGSLTLEVAGSCTAREDSGCNVLELLIRRVYLSYGIRTHFCVTFILRLVPTVPR